MRVGRGCGKSEGAGQSVFEVDGAGLRVKGLTPSREALTACCSTKRRRIVTSKLKAFAAVVVAGYDMLAIDADVVFVQDPTAMIARLSRGKSQALTPQDSELN